MHVRCCRGPCSQSAGEHSPDTAGRGRGRTAAGEEGAITSGVRHLAPDPLVARGRAVVGVRLRVCPTDRAGAKPSTGTPALRGVCGPGAAQVFPWRTHEAGVLPPHPSQGIYNPLGAGSGNRARDRQVPETGSRQVQGSPLPWAWLSGVGPYSRLFINSLHIHRPSSHILPAAERDSYSQDC